MEKLKPKKGKYKYRCYCMKYQGLRFKGICCEVCGTDVEHWKKTTERIRESQWEEYIKDKNK